MPRRSVIQSPMSEEQKARRREQNREAQRRFRRGRRETCERATAENIQLKHEKESLISRIEVLQTRNDQLEEQLQECLASALSNTVSCQSTCPSSHSPSTASSMSSQLSDAGAMALAVTTQAAVDNPFAVCVGNSQESCQQPPLPAGVHSHISDGSLPTAYDLLDTGSSLTSILGYSEIWPTAQQNLWTPGYSPRFDQGLDQGMLLQNLSAKLDALLNSPLAYGSLTPYIPLLPHDTPPSYPGFGRI